MERLSRCALHSSHAEKRQTSDQWKNEMPKLRDVQQPSRLPGGREFHVAFPVTACQSMAEKMHSTELMLSKVSVKWWFQ